MKTLPEGIQFLEDFEDGFGVRKAAAVGSKPLVFNSLVSKLCQASCFEGSQGL